MLTEFKVLGHDESPYDLGKKQWDILDALESRYEDSDMSEITYNDSTMMSLQKTTKHYQAAFLLWNVL